MFYVNGLPILADEISVIAVLKAQLKELGIERFYSYHNRGEELQICCPYHKEGQERRPSASISLITKTDKDGRKIPAGTFHCFACQTTSSLTEMISHCFGKKDLGQFGIKWLMENFTRATELVTRESLALPNPYMDIKKSMYIPEEQLAEYRVYHPYMYKRGLTDELIELFDVGYDPKFKLESHKDKKLYNVPSLTFPVRDKTGGALFVARRSVEGKIFHYPTDVQKPVYGLYELYEYWDVGVDKDKNLLVLDELYIVESILNCITCWKYHVPAVALLGTGTPQQLKEIERIPVRKYVLAYDPDEAGDRGVARFLKNVHKTNIEIMDIPEGLDVNDLSEEEFEKVPRIRPNDFKISFDGIK